MADHIKKIREAARAARQETFQALRSLDRANLGKGSPEKVEASK